MTDEAREMTVHEVIAALPAGHSAKEELAQMLFDWEQLAKIFGLEGADPSQVIEEARHIAESIAAQADRVTMDWQGIVHRVGLLADAWTQANPNSPSTLLRALHACGTDLKRILP